MRHNKLAYCATCYLEANIADARLLKQQEFSSYLKYFIPGTWGRNKVIYKFVSLIIGTGNLNHLNQLDLECFVETAAYKSLDHL